MAEIPKRQGRDQDCNPHRINRTGPVAEEFFLDIPLKSRFISFVPIESNREGEANRESTEAQRNNFGHIVSDRLFLSA